MEPGTPYPAPEPGEILTEEERVMMLQNILKMGHFSYEQEEKREQSLLNQSAQILVALSIFSAVVYVLVPTLLDYTVVSSSALFFALAITSLFMVSSFILTILAQWRYSYEAMPDIHTIYTAIEREYDCYRTESAFLYQWKDQLTHLHLSKQKLNNRRTRLIRASMVLFLVAIASVIFSILILYVAH